MTPKELVLVEDDAQIRRMYERAFRLHGYEVTCLENGEDAWKHLSQAQQSPAAIVLDIMMPKVSGLALLKLIRGDQRFAKTPIAILTNTFNYADEHALLDLGADLYFVKIENQSKDIIDKINKLVDERLTAQH